MSFYRVFATLSQSRNRVPLLFSQLHSLSERSSFGIAFDIDGVVLRGNTPIGGSPQALIKLYDECSGTLKIPYVFLTNGGGVRESKRALELSKLLGFNILPSQVIQGHSPFKQLVNRFENELVVAVGKGEPAAVMSEYGFKNVLSIEEYASYFENIDPLAQYKKWTTNHIDIESITRKEMAPRNDVCSQRVHAAFVVSDSVDWSRDIQVLCDILRTGGLPGREIAHQPPLYFANDDLEYQAIFPSERLGMGAFRIALESIFNCIHSNPLEYTSFGKPNPSVFKNAETVLTHLALSLSHDLPVVNVNGGSHVFRTLYMIVQSRFDSAVEIGHSDEGWLVMIDRSVVDGKLMVDVQIKAGHPWFSILTRTGVFKGKENHVEYPADLVVDTVEEAVDYILTKEKVS